MHRPLHGKAKRTHAEIHNGFHANGLIPLHTSRTIRIKGGKHPALTRHLRATPIQIMPWGINQTKESRCPLRRGTWLALVQQLRKAGQSAGRPQRQRGFNQRDRHKARSVVSGILRSFHGCYVGSIQRGNCSKMTLENSKMLLNNKTHAPNFHRFRGCPVASQLTMAPNISPSSGPTTSSVANRRFCSDS